MKVDEHMYKRALQRLDFSLFLLVNLFLSDLFFGCVLNVSQLDSNYFLSEDVAITYSNIASQLGFVVILLTVLKVTDGKLKNVGVIDLKKHMNTEAVYEQRKKKIAELLGFKIARDNKFS